MELTKEQQGRLEYAKASLKASDAYLAPFRAVTEIHEDFDPIEVVLAVFKMTSGDELLKTAIAADILFNDEAINGFVSTNQRESNLPVSNPYVTPKPKAEPAKETVVIGWETPKGSGFYVGKGGQYDYQTGTLIAYPPPGVTIKPGWAPAGNYVREDQNLGGDKPFGVVRAGWRKV